MTLVGALDTIGDGIAIQRISWRRPRAIDFQSIQGALTADSLGNLLSGLTGTVPNTTYAASIAVADLTRVAARVVGICVGVIFVVLAFLPKLVAVIVAIPGPVVAAYFMVLVASLFILGVRVLMQDDLDHRKSFAVGLAFWLGIAFQLDWIFPEYFQGQWSDLLGKQHDGRRPDRDRSDAVRGVDRAAPAASEDAADSGKTYRRSIPFCLISPPAASAAPKITDRLRAVGEEMLLTLTRRAEDGRAPEGRHLLLVARNDGEAVDLEFAATPDETNLEDQLALLSQQVTGPPVEEEVSLRLLRHYASSVRHQQFHDTDIITVRVGPVASM